MLTRNCRGPIKYNQLFWCGFDPNPMLQCFQNYHVSTLLKLKYFNILRQTTHWYTSDWKVYDKGGKRLHQASSSASSSARADSFQHTWMERFYIVIDFVT